MGRTFCLVICCLSVFYFSSAQQETIEHSIKKGETVFSIAKQYEVTMKSIFDLNPQSRDVIYAGSMLTIPKVSKTSTPNSNKNSSEIRTYTVVRGDTKSGLSERFNVSIASLEQQNPQIVAMLQAGHILKIDPNFVAEKVKVRNGERLVNKGETLWGIAKENNISVDALIAANKNRLDGVLKAGQTLRIPDKNDTFNNDGFYTVQKGDTKWGLSKRFDTTIAQLEASNPQIVDLLMAGQVINIEVGTPTVSNANTSEKTSDEEEFKTDLVETTATETENETKTENDEIVNKEYVDYIIQSKETLFGLSKKAGMSIDAFTQLNPKLKDGVIIGSKIKMPINSGLSNPTRAPILADKSNTELVSNLNLKKNIELYFYLPFTQNDFDERDLDSIDYKTSPDYKNKPLEFYEGAAIAMDSAKSLGIKFDVALFDSGSQNAIEVDRQGENSAVIIPYLSGSEYPDIVSEGPTSIISIASNFPAVGGNTVYEALPSENKQKLKILNYLKSQDANIIVVSDLDVMPNSALIKSILPEVKFVKVDKTGFFEADALTGALDSNKTNYIILSTDKTIVVLNTTTTFMNKLSEFDVQMVLLEESQIPEKGKVSEIRFRILKLIYPSALPIPNMNRFGNFEAVYERLYKKKPSEYAIIGFDSTLDLLLRLAQDSSLEETANTIKSKHLGLKFDYQKTTERNYQNKGAYILQYTSEKGILEID